jgi:hypothetical protein
VEVTNPLDGMTFYDTIKCYYPPTLAPNKSSSPSALLSGSALVIVIAAAAFLGFLLLLVMLAYLFNRWVAKDESLIEPAQDGFRPDSKLWRRTASRNALSKGQDVEGDMDMSNVYSSNKSHEMDTFS